MSDYENIPETLRERDQWLFWNGSNDTPRAPLDSPAAEYGCSWSDPDTWMPFEEVRENAEKVTNAGIGFVNAKDNDDYARGLIGSIDIDGAADEDGRARDWVPSLGPFSERDAYQEWSPSEQGLRIPVIGLEVPDWWSDFDNIDGEHKGVEVLTNKFSTYTGNKLQGSGDEVVEYGDWLDDWLREVYKELEGEDPLADDSVDTDDDEYTTDDEWLTEDAAEEALDAISPDCGYDTWKDIGMALVNHFGTARGGSLFKSWSRGGTKWDSDAEDQAERIISDASSYSYDAGTLVYHASSHGWDASQAAREHGTGATSSNSEATGESGDDGVKSPISEASSGYFIDRRDQDGGVHQERLTNFHIHLDAVLERDNGDAEFLITVDPITDPEVQLAVEPSVFNDRRKFERDICGATLSGTFDGGGSDLNRLKEYVAQQDAPVRRGTDHIGLHGDEWVVPDGALTADGWTDEPETVHEAEDTPLSNKVALSPNRGDDYDAEEVRRILELLPQTRLTERFLPAMGWFYAAPLRPLVQDWEGEFNILAVTGDTGAGKTATLETLWSAFGVEGDLLRADGTTFPKMRALATSNALPVVFDEYKPADMSQYAKDQLHSLLRTSTRGGIEEKGNPDGSVTGHELLAPAVISGEQALRGTAEERRTLQTNLSRQASVGGTPESEAFAKLTGGETADGVADGYDLTEHAIAYYQWILKRDENDLQSVWRASKTKAVNAVSDAGLSGLDDMRIQALQTMIFGVRLYRSFADSVAVDDIPVGERELDRAISYILDERTSTEHVSNLDRLLELAGRAAAGDYLERGEHYEIIREGQPDEELRVKLSLMYDQLRRYARDHDIQDADLLDSDGDYRSRISDAADEEDSYIAAVSKQTPGLNRCVAVSAGAAEQQIGGFEIGMFRPVDDEPEDSQDGDDLGDVDHSFSLGSMDPGRSGSVTFQATLASKLDPKPWYQAEGILQDETGVSRFIARGSENAVSEIDEATKVEIRDAMLSSDEDGAPVVEIIDGVTDVVDVSTAGDQERIKQEASTDGGANLANKPVDDFVRSLDSGEAFTIAQAAGAAGVAPDEARSRLETLVTERRVIVEGSGEADYERL